MGSNTIRLFCLSARYTKPLDYQDLLLREAVRNGNKLKYAFGNWRTGEVVQSETKDSILDLCTQTEKSI